MAVGRAPLLGLLAALLVCTVGRVAAQDSILVELLGSKYDGFVNLLEHADLLGVLEQEVAVNGGKITIFAPTDYYLANRVSSTLLAHLKRAENIEPLKKVLLHHVVSGIVNSSAWTPGHTHRVATLAGSEAQLYLEGGEMHIDGAVVRELRVLEAYDGMVHAINGFLLPQDIQDAVLTAIAEAEQVVDEEAERREVLEDKSLAIGPGAGPAIGPSAAATELTQLVDALTANGNYNQLIKYLIASGLLPELQNVLASGSPITIFAPTDSAFNAVNQTIANATQSAVDTLLLYHVAKGAYTYQDLLNLAQNTPGGAYINTTAGIPLLVTASNGQVFLGQPPVPLNQTYLASASNVQVSSVPSVLTVPSTPVVVPPPPPGAPAAPGTASSPPPPGSSGIKLGASGFLFALVALISTLLL